MTLCCNWFDYVCEPEITFLKNATMLEFRNGDAEVVVYIYNNDDIKVSQRSPECFDEFIGFPNVLKALKWLYKD